MNTNREVLFRFLQGQVVIHRLHHGRCEFLGRQAVAAAHNVWQSCQFAVTVFESFVNRIYYIKIKRIARSTGFLGAIEYGNFSDRRGQSFHKALD